jgi:hypothetical protein
LADGKANGQRLVIAKGIAGAEGFGGKLLPDRHQQ